MERRAGPAGEVLRWSNIVVRRVGVVWYGEAGRLAGGRVVDIG